MDEYIEQLMEYNPSYDAELLEKAYKKAEEMVNAYYKEI